MFPLIELSGSAFERGKQHGLAAKSQVQHSIASYSRLFAAADLDAPNPLADPVMASYAERFVDSLPGDSGHSLVLDVRKAIYLLLPMGRASIEQVALSQGLNLRTLQRRLDEEGVSFSDLINEVRRDLVRRYMDNPRYSLGRIAGLLGYSVPSSFTRWFTSQFGMAPAVWRKKHCKG